MLNYVVWVVALRVRYLDFLGGGDGCIRVDVEV